MSSSAARFKPIAIASERESGSRYASSAENQCFGLAHCRPTSSARYAGVSELMTVTPALAASRPLIQDFERLNGVCRSGHSAMSMSSHTSGHLLIGAMLRTDIRSMGSPVFAGNMSSVS